MMKDSTKNTLLSLLVMALWGSLFPFVKIGYSAFNINPASVPDVLMFAAIRFVVCGIIVLITSGIILGNKEVRHESKSC